MIDFIGNYQSNYLVPVALYGDTSYSKDTLRKLMASGSSLIPGSSTINFDEITSERIFKSIDQANLQTKKDLVKDYNLLKYKLGRVPKMVDFLNYGSRDPQLYVQKAKSYYNFVAEQEKYSPMSISGEETLLLELFAKEINNVKRVVESVLLHHLIKSGSTSIDDIIVILTDKYGAVFGRETILSAISNANFSFVTARKNKKLISVQEINNFDVVTVSNKNITMGATLKKALENSRFKSFLVDNIEYAIKVFDDRFETEKFRDGFILYQKYSRKDVFRILNWRENPLAQNVGGYIVSKDKSNCAIFVNYHKSADISDTTKYEDKFIDNSTFEWMSKSKRTLNSPDVKAMADSNGKMRFPLFIKKSNDEGTEFYYMGELDPIADSFEQTSMASEKSGDVSVVKIKFKVIPSVEEDIFEYITRGV